MTDAPTTTTDTARATSSTAVQHDGAPSVSVGLLILRLALGITFVMHGWQKFSEWGLGGTAQSFDGMDIPAPEASAVFTAVVKLAGGIALILGILTRIAGVLLALAMAGALILVHAPAGFFASDGGIELVMVLGAGALALAFTGPGRYAVARALPSRGGAQAWA
ncbi:DoxX family membrane protein [Kocuria indica]|uniref:DoxX family membrane protein n=1 Tax=Kocuria marina subsp. indica TaxID=1049583 RepID=A0A6N9QX21_9MICC|nr:DoxX family protein [Kocuria indica]NDO77782.1 DoxX family membrane protein [Kocuria indica]